MKVGLSVILPLASILIGCSDESLPSYRFTVEELNYGERSRYVFESTIAPGVSITFDLHEEILIEVSRERKLNQEVMRVVLFDYLDSGLVSIGSGTINVPTRGVSLYEWSAQNGNRYKVEVVING
ncbi:MAG: hypothetical protein AAF662_10825 [Pseudomonadota bacterium]